MPAIDRRRLGEILIEDNLVTKEQLDEALNLQQQSSERIPIGELLVQLGYLSEEGLSLALSKKLRTKYLSLSDGSLEINFDQGLDKLIDEKFARTHFVLPVSKTQRHLTVAMWDPLNFVVIDNMKRMASMELVVCCSPKKDILEGINRLYVLKGAGAQEDSAAGTVAASPAVVGERLKIKKEEADQLKLKAAEAPVVKIVNQIINQAISQKASDIHIEPKENGISIRYRVDGILYETETPPKELIAPIVSRIKILSRLDIAEKRLPQDGGFMMKAEGRSIDFRVSSIPTIYGEKLAVRVLDKEAMKVTLSSLGLSKDDLETVSECIKRPFGLILLTGPTGSGKTTTLYCMLNEIRSPKKNIVTIEDPVEYRIDGVNQVQAMPNIGLDFATGLRAFLRQDPDVIMVGEVRDRETADICVRSALVGRLVLSTLHTNDALGTISRLLDLGIEPFLVGSTLAMAIAQRLVRKLCPECKEALKLDSKTAARYKLEGAKIYGPKGCKSCNDRGFSGRLPIFEIMRADEDIKSMIERREDITVIKQALVKKGAKTLRDDGIAKVREGLTSLNEVLAATTEVV